MIYLMGCSHIMPILDACCVGGYGPQLPKIEHGRPPEFLEWQIADTALPDRLQVASLYVRHTAPFWGRPLARIVSNGVVGISPGLQGLLQAIDRSSPRTWLFCSISGEEYFHLSGAQHAQAHDFWMPSRPDLAPVAGRQLIPLEVIEKQVADKTQDAVALLSAVRSFCPGLNIAHISAPPPARSEDLLAKYQREGVAPHPIAQVGSALRLKYYLLYAHCLAAAAAAHNIPVLAPPAEATQPEGYLRPEYVDDCVHGNRRYGQLVARQMADAMEPVRAA